MLRFVHDCLETVDNYFHALWFVPDCHETQKMCNKVVDTYPSATKVVLEFYKTQEMCWQGCF